MKPKKKIALIIPNLNVGGAEKISLLILNNLSDSLFDKYLIVFSKQGQNLKKVNKKIKIINLKNSRLILNSYKIYKLIAAKKLDIVFSTFYHINIFLCFLKLFIKFKLVIRESNDPIHIFKNHSNSLFIYHLYKFFYPLADRIILPAKYLKKRFKKLSIPTTKVKIIYNPVNNKPKKKFSMRKNYFCAIGRLTYQKGFDRLIKIVNKSKVDKLYIIGSGKEKKNLIKISDPNKIKFVHETNPSKYFLESKAIFFSSRWEGMPNVLLEALKLGTKIISISKIESILELKRISKKNSIYFADEKNFDFVTKKISIKKNDCYNNLLPNNFDLNFALNKYQKELY